MEEMIDKNVYCDAIRMALKVDFLNSPEELKLYTVSLYKAMMWGINHTVKSKY